MQLVRTCLFREKWKKKMDLREGDLRRERDKENAIFLNQRWEKGIFMMKLFSFFYESCKS